MKLYFLKIFGLFLILNCTVKAISQPDIASQEPGKCYAKCLIADQFQGQEILLPIYLGDDKYIIDNYVKDTTFAVKDKSTAWEKRKSEDCMSSDPNDCLVWTLVERKSKEIHLKWYLTDTLVTKEYELEPYKIEELSKKGGFTEWIEVVCTDKIDSRLILKLRKALGMGTFNSPGYLDKELKGKITEYQKNNDLRVGNLDFETLEHLGINWK